MTEEELKVLILKDYKFMLLHNFSMMKERKIGIMEAEAYLLQQELEVEEIEATQSQK